MSKTIAVNWRDARAYGCPYCGYRSSSSHISCGGCSVATCGDCRGVFHVLADGLEESAVSSKGEGHPKLQDHPRAGIPSHGRPDRHPEFFYSRGVGMDHTPGCFICGGEAGLHANISGFVQCKAAGERVITMFETGARLDYRDFEPDYVQVKVGACEKHKGALEALHQKTKCCGVISEDIIKKAAGGPNEDRR